MTVVTPLVHPGAVMRISDDLNAYNRALYAYRRANGLCVKCTKPSVAGKALCPRHIASAARRDSRPERIQAHSRWSKRWREQRIENGLCVRCKNPLTTLDRAGCVSCTACSQMALESVRTYQARVRSELRAAGLCLLCGGRRRDNRYVNCGGCRTRQTRSAQRRREENKAVGLCSRCGGERDTERFLQCTPCREAMRTYRREWKRRERVLS
jgi:hypothetical protein